LGGKGGLRGNLEGTGNRKGQILTTEEAVQEESNQHPGETAGRSH